MYSERTHDTPDRGGYDVGVTDAYEAGHPVRRHGHLPSEAAKICWRAGWKKADREVTEGGGPPVGHLDGNGAEPWALNWVAAGAELGSAAHTRSK